MEMEVPLVEFASVRSVIELVADAGRNVLGCEIFLKVLEGIDIVGK